MNIVDFRSWASLGAIPLFESEADLRAVGHGCELAWIRSTREFVALHEAHCRPVPPERLAGVLRNLLPRLAPATSKPSRRQACVVFTADDGDIADLEKLGPLARNLNVPFVLGIVSGRVGKDPRTMSLEQIRQMVAWGCEVAAHSVSHPKLALLSGPRKQKEIADSFRWLRSHGLQTQHFIYPFGGPDVISERIIRSVAQTGCLVKAGMVCPPFFSTRIPRWALGSFFRGGVSTFEGYRNLVDEAARGRRMLVWMLHPGSPQHDAEQQAHLVRLIEYCRSRAILVTSLTAALEVHGNLWESPVNYGGEMLVDCDGVVWLARAPFMLRLLQWLEDSRLSAILTYGASRILSTIKAGRRSIQ